MLPDYLTISENRWLKLIDYPLTDKSKIFTFMSFLGVISLFGGSVNLFIIGINVMHKLRFFREIDYYSSPCTRSSSIISYISGISLSANDEVGNERKSQYFNALSSHARFRYSHVVLALSIFHLTSTLIFIPILGAHICVDMDIDLANSLIMVTLTWMPFQVLFMSVFLFINTCIQFFSICFPLRFRLRRSPLLGSFILLLLVCLGHSSSCRFMLRYEIYSMFDLVVNNRTDPDVERAKQLIEAALTAPFAIYCLTGILTIGLYASIIHNINFGRHLAFSGSLYLDAIGEANDEDASSTNLPRTEERAQKWKKVVKRNLQNLVMLATTTTIFYVSEIPIFLAQYDHVAPRYWTLICHCSVHITCSLSHIILSKQFKKAARELIATTRRRSLEIQLQLFKKKGLTPSIFSSTPKDEET